MSDDAKPLEGLVPMIIDQNGRVEVEGPMAFSLNDGTIFEVCPFKKGEKVFLVFPENAFTIANIRRSADALAEAHRNIGPDGKPRGEPWILIPAAKPKGQPG